jgi:hypothetical protein
MRIHIFNPRTGSDLVSKICFIIFWPRMIFLWIFESKLHRFESFQRNSKNEKGFPSPRGRSQHLAHLGPRPKSSPQPMASQRTAGPANGILCLGQARVRQVCRLPARAHTRWSGGDAVGGEPGYKVVCMIRASIEGYPELRRVGRATRDLTIPTIPHHTI